jgi:protein-S-isoprenylcysteine O-methyltransferase Ste14
MQMTSAFWNSPLFWVGLFFVGFTFTVIIYRRPTAKEKVSRAPRIVQRAFAWTFYLLPMLALPLLPQPRLSWPVAVGIVTGLALLIGAVVTKVTAKREFGAQPGLRQKDDLVTTGIYSRVRNPKYLSNVLLAVGWALLFRGIHALLCVPLWAFGFILLIFFEEKELEDEYGEAYREYEKKVPWRLIPRVF